MFYFLVWYLIFFLSLKKYLLTKLHSIKLQINSWYVFSSLKDKNFKQFFKNFSSLSLKSLLLFDFKNKLKIIIKHKRLIKIKNKMTRFALFIILLNHTNEMIEITLEIKNESIINANLDFIIHIWLTK